MVAAAIRTIFAQPTGSEVCEQVGKVAAMLEPKFPAVASMLVDAREELTAFAAFPVAHWTKIWSTDERFKAGVALLAGWDGVSLLGGRGRPRSKEQGRGAGSPAAQLALEGPTVAPQWWRPRPLRSGRHWGLVAGRLGCHPATSWR